MLFTNPSHPLSPVTPGRPSGMETGQAVRLGHLGMPDVGSGSMHDSTLADDSSDLQSDVPSTGPLWLSVLKAPKLQAPKMAVSLGPGPGPVASWVELLTKGPVMSALAGVKAAMESADLGMDDEPMKLPQQFVHPQVLSCPTPR